MKTDKIVAMKFKEKLPLACPPAESVDVELSDVWRLLNKLEVDEKEFLSHTALEKENKRNICACRWSSCSLFEGEQNVNEMVKLPLYKRFAARAQLKIPQGSGLSLKKKNHIDFWAFDAFDFVLAVEKVVKR